MKKIFSIVCHKLTNPLIFTVNYLRSFEDNIILVHVDAKTNIDDFKFLASDNVIFITERVSVEWGRVSQIYATLNLMNESTRFDYDYFFLISGDDIPIMRNKSINEFLKDNSQYDFIHFQDFRNTYVDPCSRIKYRYPDYFFEREMGLKNRILRKSFKFIKDIFYLNKDFIEYKKKGLVFYKGTNWFTLRRENIDFIMKFIESDLQFLNMFKGSLCADEVFFHTILKLNKKINIYNDDEAINNALRYIDWSSGPEFPKILNEKDYNKITSSNSMFARKFPSDLSYELFLSIINR
ncbi:beta-1,6-N-acetylglucosaminyltransferase [Tatumella ptyseos]|uniref:beta-1,6-N-acetylglucosaminyltransferase n=1 Tax=Tatumella ptyseos TaxID=82987 RepID=UPI0026EB77B4|nr:beta-1,6-N-acetylglucosaminyltransferase [Tatumella ptyseos]WKX27174.1 beta-1,6-N-acetylglucosaminyltransferase [Tatumella ptyseos]